MADNLGIPAPIDNKNVMEDWIQEVFDNQSCIYGNKKAVGFINGCPVFASWNENILYWRVVEGCWYDTITILKDRLKQYNDANTDLRTIDDVVESMLIQRFYWKD